MPIELICKGCASKLRVPEEHAGKQARCPSCGAVTPVPAAAALYSRPDSEPASPFSTSPTSAASDSPWVSSPPAPTAHDPAPNAPTNFAPTNFAPTTFPAASFPQAAQSAQAAPTMSAGGGAATTSPGGSANGRWFMRSEVGQTYGPVLKAELDRWVAEGRVSARSFLAAEGSAEWQPAGNLYPQLIPQWTGPMPQPMGAPNAGNPWADQPAANMNPYAPGGAFGQGYMRPHRAGAVLACGILSWFVCIILGVIAIVMAREDIQLMKRGQMDPSGMGMTQIGMAIAWLHVGLTLLGIIFVVIASVLSEM